MTEYHKIQTIYKRDLSDKKKPLLIGQWSLPEFEYLANCNWTWTEKVDGTNIRLIWNGTHVSVMGRTDLAQIPRPLLTFLTEKFSEDVFKNLNYPHMCLYGEGYGPGIQNGGAYRSDVSFILFDVMINNLWLERENVVDIAQHLQCDVVPVVGQGTIHEAIDWMQSNPNSLLGNTKSEGLVIRPTVELCTRRGERIITKIKHKDFINAKFQ